MESAVIYSSLFKAPLGAGKGRELCEGKFLPANVACKGEGEKVYLVGVLASYIKDVLKVFGLGSKSFRFPLHPP